MLQTVILNINDSKLAVRMKLVNYQQSFIIRKETEQTEEKTL